MAEVSLRNVFKIYDEGNKGGDKKAIDDISFTVRDKEFMVLVGPSGCGKSTLLRMIAGLEDISSGTVTIDGIKVNQTSPRDRDIAMVFQNYALYPHMTVYENMAFGLKLKRLNKKEIRKRVVDTAELLELTDELYKRPKALSGGQRQRVAIGRAIIRRPKVFLFDEPLSNLDAKLRSQMRVELQKLHRDINATMIYVTHDQTEAMTLGNRIAVLNKGRLMQLDAPLHLYNHPVNKFVAGFIGSPTMNFIKGSIEKNDKYYFVNESTDLRVCLGDSIPPEVKKYEKPLQIGIRPEHVSICEANSLEGPDPAGSSLEVMAYENMGNEQLIYLSLADQTLIVRQPPSESIYVGRKNTVRFLTDKIIYIDDESGTVIKK